MIGVEDWGEVDYREALERQRTIFDSLHTATPTRREEDGVIVFCEHPSVYTIGRSGQLANAMGVEVVRIERGGDVTWHGPGQVVVYPIIRLPMGLRDYVAALEQAVIDTAARFGVTATRIAGKTGVWVERGAELAPCKICAIGIRASRGVVMHGLALNVTADLQNFSRINPCGMAGAEVTSLEREIGAIDIAAVKSVLRERLFDSLGI